MQCKSPGPPEISMSVSLGVLNTLCNMDAMWPSAPFTASYSELKIYNKFCPCCPRRSPEKMVDYPPHSSSGDQAAPGVCLVTSWACSVTGPHNNLEGRPEKESDASLSGLALTIFLGSGGWDG